MLIKTQILNLSLNGLIAGEELMRLVIGIDK